MIWAINCCLISVDSVPSNEPRMSVITSCSDIVALVGASVVEARSSVVASRASVVEASVEGASVTVVVGASVVGGTASSQLTPVNSIRQAHTIDTSHVDHVTQQSGNNNTTNNSAFIFPT